MPLSYYFEINSYAIKGNAVIDLRQESEFELSRTTQNYVNFWVRMDLK